MSPRLLCHFGLTRAIQQQPSPAPPPPDVEITEQFLDPNSQEGRRIRIGGLTATLSSLGRRIVLELPEGLLEKATSFEESIEGDIMTIHVKQKGELMGSCSTRIAEGELEGEEDMYTDPMQDQEEGAVLDQGAAIPVRRGDGEGLRSVAPTRRPDQPSPLHRSSGVQLELYGHSLEPPSTAYASRTIPTPRNPPASSRQTGLGAGWADHARSAAAAAAATPSTRTTVEAYPGRPAATSTTAYSSNSPPPSTARSSIPGYAVLERTLRNADAPLVLQRRAVDDEVVGATVPLAGREVSGR